MDAGTAARLEVWRGGRKVFEGAPEDLVRAAHEGRLRHSDRIAVPGRADRLPPHAFAELAPLVPGPEEARLRRFLRILVAFDVAAGSFAALSLLAGGPLPADRNGLATLAIFFAVVFVLPAFVLRRRVRELAAARARGVVPGVTVPRTSGDPGLDVLLRRPAVATRALTVAIVASSIAAFASPGWADLLVKSNARILAGEWWRLVTVALVHGGIAHLAFNALALWNLGELAEALYGRARFLAIFVVGTAAATAASVAYTAADAVGASGGVFAVVGAVLVFALRARGALPEHLRRRLVRDMTWIVGVNLLFGFTAGYVDNAAHLGGLACGAALGAVLGPGAEFRRLVGTRRR